MQLVQALGELPPPAVMTVEGCICLPFDAQSGDLAGAAASAATRKIICTEIENLVLK